MNLLLKWPVYFPSCLMAGIILAGCRTADETPMRVDVVPHEAALVARATIDAALELPTPPALDAGTPSAATPESTATSTNTAVVTPTGAATPVPSPTSSETPLPVATPTSTSSPVPVPTPTETVTPDHPATATAAAGAMSTAIAATLEAMAVATELVHNVETAVAATNTAIAVRNPTATSTVTPTATATATPRPAPVSPTPRPASVSGYYSVLRLAYAYGDVGNSDVAVYAVEGAVQSTVANQRCDEAEPSWAPDERSVIYQSDCPGNYDLYIVDVDSGRTRQLTTTTREDEREPEISPDSGWIAYRSNGAGSDRNADGTLYLMDMNDGRVRSLGLAGRAPTWSPSGRQLAYMSNATGSWEIYVYDLEDDLGRQVTVCAENCRFPAWSPDGRHVIYHATTGPESTTPDTIWKIAADGGSPAALVSGENPGRATWSQAGLIAFNSNRGIELVDEEGGQRQTLLNGNIHWAPDWSR